MRLEIGGVDRCCVLKTQRVDREMMWARNPQPEGGDLRRETGSVDRCCVLKTQHVDGEML